jgi:hypothetical protein
VGWGMCAIRVCCSVACKMIPGSADTGSADGAHTFQSMLITVMLSCGGCYTISSLTLPHRTLANQLNRAHAGLARL